ncbi:MAG: hypothetical protein IJT41_13065 [Clostridia bacterium]|nr:hypothetical protein [Clostridia bacterium]
MKTETIRNKLRELDQQKEQAIAQLNAICGAQQVLQELLSEAEEEDKPDE